MIKSAKPALFSIAIIATLAFYISSSREDVQIVETSSITESFDEMSLASLSEEDCMEIAAGGPPTIAPAIYLDPVTGEEVNPNAVNMRGPASDQRPLEYYEDATSGFNPCQ